MLARDSSLGSSCWKRERDEKEKPSKESMRTFGIADDRLGSFLEGELV